MSNFYILIIYLLLLIICDYFVYFINLISKNFGIEYQNWSEA